MRTKIMAGLAALTLAASTALAVAPANARSWHHHHHGHWHGGGAVAGFAAGALLGGALAANGPYYYGPGYGYYTPYAYSPPAYSGGGAVAYCESRFKSYDPASGTYLGYDGYRHSCP